MQALGGKSSRLEERDRSAIRISGNQISAYDRLPLSAQGADLGYDGRLGLPLPL